VEAIMTIEIIRFEEMLGVGNMEGEARDDSADDVIGDEEFLSWDDVDASEWSPANLVTLLDEFADRYLEGGRVAHRTAAASLPSFRTWRTVSPEVSLGRQVGFEAAEILATYPDIHPSDVVVLCDRHRDGLDAVTVVEACGYPMAHAFADRRRDRDAAWARLGWDGPGVKGCRTDQFHGDASTTTARVIVVGVGQKASSRRRFHAALASLVASYDGRPVLVAVVNGDPELAEFGSVFDEGIADPEAVEAGTAAAFVDWSPPDPAHRIQAND
jgi:hypothetical protein